MWEERTLLGYLDAVLSSALRWNCGGASILAEVAFDFTSQRLENLQVEASPSTCLRIIAILSSKLCSSEQCWLTTWQVCIREAWRRRQPYRSVECPIIRRRPYILGESAKKKVLLHETLPVMNFKSHEVERLEVLALEIATN